MSILKRNNLAVVAVLAIGAVLCLSDQLQGQVYGNSSINGLSTPQAPRGSSTLGNFRQFSTGIDDSNRGGSSSMLAINPRQTLGRSSMLPGSGGGGAGAGMPNSRSMLAVAPVVRTFTTSLLAAVPFQPIAGSGFKPFDVRSSDWGKSVTSGFSPGGNTFRRTSRLKAKASAMTSMNRSRGSVAGFSPTGFKQKKPILQRLSQLRTRQSLRGQNM